MIDYAVRKHCDLLKVGGEIYPRPNSLAYPKKMNVLHHKTLENMNNIIYDLKHNGHIEDLRNKWWYRLVPKKKCDEYRQLENGITMKNAGGIFIIIAFGAVLTLIMLQAENYYYEIRTRLDMKKSKETTAAPVKKATRLTKRCIIQ